MGDRGPLSSTIHLNQNRSLRWAMTPRDSTPAESPFAANWHAEPCPDGLAGPGYSSERPQQIVGAMIDYRAGPSREGHLLLGVLTVHVSGIDREQHHNYQGCQKPSHPPIVNGDGSRRAKSAPRKPRSRAGYRSRPRRTGHHLILLARFCRPPANVEGEPMPYRGCRWPLL